jgi:integrase
MRLARGHDRLALARDLGYATRDYGQVPLRELERMVDELAGWQTRLPAVLVTGSSVRCGRRLLRRSGGATWAPNPAKLIGPNRQPPPRPIRAYTLVELDALAADLSPRYRPMPAFAAATGLRPEEWAALERRDIDRGAGIVNVCSSVSDVERHYGALLDGAHAGIAGRLDAHEAKLEQVSREATEDV